MKQTLKTCLFFLNVFYLQLHCPKGYYCGLLRKILPLKIVVMQIKKPLKRDCLLFSFFLSLFFFFEVYPESFTFQQ